MAFDRTSQADLTALKNEVELDPNAYGYDPIGPTQDILDMLNLRRPEFTQSEPEINQADVRAACTYNAYNNLSIDEQEWLRWMTQNGDKMVVTPDVRLNLTDAEGDGTNSIWAVADRVAMNAAMLALIDRDGSRAEDLFGYGTTISRTDWIEARDKG